MNPSVVKTACPSQIQWKTVGVCVQLCLASVIQGLGNGLQVCSRWSGSLRAFRCTLLVLFLLLHQSFSSLDDHVHAT